MLDRFPSAKPICVENTEENRRSYRELLFTTPRLSTHISGVLMSEETLWQKSVYGVPFPELLAKQGVLPGVTADKEFLRLPFAEDEWVSRGTDELAERCALYHQLGCRFARWRTSFRVDSGHRPSLRAVQSNLYNVARYASVAQENSLVPIMEVALLTNNASYDLHRAVEVLTSILAEMFYLLQEYKVPTAVAGITFLSGNQRMEEVTTLLDHVNRIDGRKPWPLTFCFGRPLQAGVLVLWLGMDERKEMSQKELYKRAKENSQASLGVYLINKKAVENAYSQELNASK